MHAKTIEEFVSELPQQYLWRADPPDVFLQFVAGGGVTPRAKDDKRWAKAGTASQQFGGVSLFDFSVLTEGDSMTLSKCAGFLSDQPHTVFLGIHREGEIIDTNRLYEATNRPHIQGSIRPVEVCMVGTIPASRFGPVYVREAPRGLVLKFGDAGSAARYFRSPHTLKASVKV